MKRLWQSVSQNIIKQSITVFLMRVQFSFYVLFAFDIVPLSFHERNTLDVDEYNFLSATEVHNLDKRKFVSAILSPNF
jgi:hypothetical protein